MGATGSIFITPQRPFQRTFEVKPIIVVRDRPAWLGFQKDKVLSGFISACLIAGNPLKPQRGGQSTQGFIPPLKSN
ncbi:MAG: hypothetical protein EBT06_07610 [Gammaproteobacteria bacterium]|nr:hypothetical protein [Gammaproteobacteria bacterium]NBY22321.1 hypothetical protein [Gammaproteobacteria bacterium]